VVVFSWASAGQNEVRAISSGRQTVAPGNVRSRVSWRKVVGCGSASGPGRRRHVDERRGGVIWEQFLIDTCCGMRGFEARAGARGPSQQPWTRDGRGEVPMRIGCAVPAPAVGRAWLLLRHRLQGPEAQADPPVPPQRPFHFVWLEASPRRSTTPSLPKGSSSC
jgi:hypothetical protein